MRRSHHVLKIEIDGCMVKRRLLVVLEATYTRIYGQHQFGKCWYVARSQPTSEKFYVVKFIHVKYFRTFSTYENIFTTKIKRITVLDFVVQQRYCNCS